MKTIMKVPKFVPVEVDAEVTSELMDKYITVSYVEGEEFLRLGEVFMYHVIWKELATGEVIKDFMDEEKFDKKFPVTWTETFKKIERAIKEFYPGYKIFFKF